MSYLKFDKNLLINLDQSLRKEMLRTNQSGAYHCTTLTDCNTRRQHGLLVIPLPGAGGEPHVMLSSLDETVIQHGAQFNLAVHRYDGGVTSPNGHKYIREFDCERVPRTTYRVGGVILTKEKIFISHANRILIRYTLVEAHSETTLRLRPLLAFRHANDICVANDKINTETRRVDHGIANCLYEGYPSLYMQTSAKSEFIDMPDWYRHFEYFKDRERLQHEGEDLWTPGYFEMPIKPGESIIFSAGTSEIATGDLQEMYEKELSSRTCRTSFFNCLKNAAKQFYLKADDGKMYIITRYPWSEIRARDIFIALPGATLAIDHRADFEKIMETASEALLNYLNKGDLDPVIGGIDRPDVPLWALRDIQEYAEKFGIKEARARYGKLTKEIINAIIDGKHPNLNVDDRGLIETSGVHQPASWMSARLPGQNTPIVPRTGYLVEFNAMWYNALRFAEDLFDDLKREAAWCERIGAIASALAPEFISTFLNEAGYLWDFVDPVNGANPEVRPNMAIAIGLRHTPLSRRQRKGVLDIVTRELLTPKGLRTLSPKSGAYRPNYVGSDWDRALALHNGTTRPWLVGFFADAYLSVYGLSGAAYIDRMLIGFEDDMSQNCIGAISQVYDGNPPYDGHGAISHCCNVAEVLRALTTLRDFEKAEEERWLKSQAQDTKKSNPAKPSAKK